MKEVPRRRNKERNERVWRGCDAVGCHSNAVSFYYLWYGAIYKRQYTDKRVTLSKCMCMWASELRKFWHFHILKLLLFQYFVGTLKISHDLISFGGGGGQAPPHQYASDWGPMMTMYRGNMHLFQSMDLNKQSLWIWAMKFVSYYKIVQCGVDVQ